MDIYVKPNKKVLLHEKGSVYIKDIAEISTSDDLMNRVKNIKVMEIKNDESKNYLITIIDIINAVDKALPGHTINNVGEMDTVVEFSPKDRGENKVFKVLKIIFVVMVLFAGSSTAIMSFHSDSQMATVFGNYYYMFFNEKVENPILIDLPYSIGLALGIIVFFNHFSGKSLTNDPTPIEVELSLYETDVTDNIIDTLNTQRSNKRSSDKNDGS